MSEDGIIICDTPDNVNAWRLLSLKAALHLEMLGMRHSRGSVYALVKREFGLKGNKRRVYGQFCNHLRRIGVLSEPEIGQIAENLAGDMNEKLRQGQERK